jgi:hypothetical protein
LQPLSYAVSDDGVIEDFRWARHPAFAKELCGFDALCGFGQGAEDNLETVAGIILKFRILPTKEGLSVFTVDWKDQSGEDVVQRLASTDQFVPDGFPILGDKANRVDQLPYHGGRLPYIERAILDLKSVEARHMRGELMQFIAEDL